MARLLLFNPEHDYALAHGEENYMPPASVRSLASRLILLPLIWSKPEDYILIGKNEVYAVAEGQLLPLADVSKEITHVEPWGWDLYVRRKLIEAGVDESLLPGRDYIDDVRRLSHRRISIIFNSKLQSPFVPVEFSDMENALYFYRNSPDCYFKLPWSSGGRGVVATGELKEKQVKEWISGGIRRQGSVLGEKGIKRAVDFASLWNIDDSGKTHFEGFSISLSDGRGKYDGNVFGPQEELEKMLNEKATGFSKHLIDVQKQILSEEVAPFYSGKLGIDMMADSEGTVYPCVEVNLRRTMGHVAMDYMKMPDSKREILKDVPLPLKSLKSL